mgnify:CR=1 FL=1
MKKIYLPLILFILLILEGLTINYLPNEIAFSDYLITAHWILAFLVYTTVYYDNENTYYSIIYAFIFGLFIDIIYTGVLGVYMFSYGIVTYVLRVMQKWLHRNVFVLILFGVTAFVLSDLLIYLMYAVVGITEMIWRDYWLMRSVPTLIANLLFLLLLFPLFKNRLVQWGNEQLDKGN